MFDKIYPGADSAMLGFVALFAISEAIGKARADLAEAVSQKPVMFILFDGVRPLFFYSKTFILPYSVSSMDHCLGHFSKSDPIL